MERSAESFDADELGLAGLDCDPAMEQISFSRMSGVIAIVDQGVASAATFFASVIVGRCCGSTELGIYSLAFTLVLLCYALQALKRGDVSRAISAGVLKVGPLD